MRYNQVMGYSKETVKGVSWMSGFRIVSRSVVFLKMAVLARILTPAEFGIYGIATLVLALLEILTETGINVILIQSKNNIDEYNNSAWVVSMIRGTFISLCIIVSTPFIASFFNTPNSVNILLLISLVPFIKGFINPAEVKLQKDLMFRYEFWFRTSIFTFDAMVAVISVILTHSVYGLVWGLVAGALLEVLISFSLIRPIPKLGIRKDYFNEIFHKGKWITAYGVFNYIAQNGDNLTVGKVMGASALGVYAMAYNISILPISEVSDVVSKVVFPVYVKMVEDKRRLMSAFAKSTLVISVLTILMGLILFLFSGQIISLVLGNKWLSGVQVLKVLAIYGVLRAISGSSSALFLAVEKQKYVTNMTFVRFVALAVTIYPLVKTFGLIGAGYSALFSVIIEIPIILFYVGRVFKS
jgi:O-antigen/teichoic acid export membrane protein